MEPRVNSEPIINALIEFLEGTITEIPPEFYQILKEPKFIKNKQISIFFAKALRHIQAKKLEIDSNHQSSFHSIYHGLFHPSTIIRTFCSDQFARRHPKNANINDSEYYTNYIEPSIHFIRDKLIFMDYSQDTDLFDKEEKSTKCELLSFANSSATEGLSIKYIESHLYSALKVLINKLSDSIIDNHLLVTTDNDLWNVLLNQININNKDLNSEHTQRKLSCCCCILCKLLQCSNHFLFWEHHNLSIPDIDSLIRKLCDLFSNSITLTSDLYKQIAACLQVCVFITPGPAQGSRLCNFQRTGCHLLKIIR